MKNIFRFLMAVAILFTASCAKEDISSSIGGGEVEMTFTVDLPELGTRAYADGAKATTLRYYVYDDVDDNYLPAISSESLPEKKVTLVDGKAVVTLPLLKGMTYNIIFWADNGSDIYTIDPATKVLTVDYTGVMSNDDSRDAFYKYLTNVDPTDAVKIKEQAKVTLTRPFGQLNAATSDFEAVENNGVTLTTSTLKAIKANNTLDLTTGLARNQVNITFAEAAIPTEALPNKTGYKYLSMNYLLPGTVDAEYTFKGKRSDNSEVVFTGTTYTNVPVKANYRTNILGKLLTATTDFTVTIEKDFDEPDEDYQVVTVNVPSNNTEDIVISVGTTQVTVPAAAAQAGDKYKVVVSNEDTATDSASGATTVAFDLTLYKNDVKVSGGDVVYAVTKNIGAGLFISEVTHNGTALTNATTGADQTYTYDAATGVLTIYTKSFSPFAVTYKTDPAENFADNSWEDIIRVCQNNAVPSSWNVGDKKTMNIGGSSYDIAIIGKDHDTYSDGSGKAPLTLQPTKVCGSAAMNATQTNATGWSASQMRTVTMVEILSAMPSEVQNAIKAVDKLTLKGDGSGLETTSDKLFLISLIECYGSTFYSNGFEEGSRYAYYSSIEDRILDASWWLRGPGINNGKNNGIGFTQINMSGYMANGSAETKSGVVFGFCF